MKHLFTVLVCAFTLTTASVSFAQEAPNLRDSANAAAESANSEANAPDSTANTAQVVTEVVASGEGGGSAEGAAPTLDENSGAEDVVFVVKAIIEAGKNGQWGLLVGLCLMLLVFLMSKLRVPFLNATVLSKFPPKSIPWVAAGLGILGSVAAELIAGQMAWYLAVPNGIFIGVSAVGLWEMIGKHVAPKKEAEAEAA